MSEGLGVLAAVLSSSLGGTSIAATRFLAGLIDPLAIGSFRFGIGFALLLPIALLRRTSWPAREDWPVVGGLGLLFFTLFPILFNASLIFTTAARGALALSTLPLLTMLVGAALGREALTLRKTAGVLITMAGVAATLVSGLAAAPPGAWRGDLLMMAAALCMALYSVWSKPYIGRVGAIGFTTMAMGVGGAALIAIASVRGSFGPVEQFGAPQGLAALYLGAFGAALTFYLWSLAIEKTTPTRVAISITVNPIAAALTAALILDEPLRWTLWVGIVAVFLGISIAVTRGGAKNAVSAPSDSTHRDPRSYRPRPASDN